MSVEQRFNKNLNKYIFRERNNFQQDTHDLFLFEYSKVMHYTCQMTLFIKK